MPWRPAQIQTTDALAKLFDPRPKLAPPSKAPAIKPVDLKSFFDDIKRVVSFEEFRPMTPKELGEGIQKGASKK